MQTIKARLTHQSGTISYIDVFIKLPTAESKLTRLIINSFNNAGLNDKLVKAELIDL